MNLTCPCCHAKYPLEAALEGAAAGELQRLLAQAGPLARPLIAYLGLFRSKTRALSFDRAVRLAAEVLALSVDGRQLALALAETVEAIRAKRDQGQIKPLTNHNYLRRVLESVGADPRVCPDPPACPDWTDQGAHMGAPLRDTPPTGKRARAMADLAAWGAGDWLRSRIADGLAALVVMGLDGAPGADVITRTADVWHHVMAGSCGIEAVDSQRVKAAFSGLLKSVEKWPEPKAIWAHMPRRPSQPRLAEPPEDADQRRQGAELARKLARKFGNRLKTEG